MRIGGRWAPNLANVIDVVYSMDQLDCNFVLLL